MRTSRVVFLLFAAVIAVMMLSACGGGGSPVVGTWYDWDSVERWEFRKDGVVIVAIQGGLESRGDYELDQGLMSIDFTSGIAATVGSSLDLDCDIQGNVMTLSSSSADFGTTELVRADSRPDKALVGKWEEIDGDEVMELRADGTVLLTDPDGPWEGSYIAVGQERMRFEFAEYGVIAFDVSLTGQELSLTAFGDEVRYRKVR